MNTVRICAYTAMDSVHWNIYSSDFETSKKKHKHILIQSSLLEHPT